MRRALLNSAREKRAVPHPRDRSVRQLEKKEKRAIRLDAQKTRLKTEQTLQLMRFFWFREQCIALNYTTTAVPDDVVALLAQLYVERNDDEVAVLKMQRNPPLGRIKTLEATRQREMDELMSVKGLRVPSLSAADDVEILTDIWDGTKETVTVVRAVGFSMASRPAPSRAALAQLSERLRPVADVRDEAPVTLPKRAVKFHAAQYPAANQHNKSLSVKKTEDSLTGVKARAKVREEAKRQKRLKEQRNAALANRRV
jgi:translation machinery-associated protein 16